MPDAKRYGREQNGAAIGRKGGGALGAGKKVDHRGPTTGEKVRAQGGLQHRNAAQARINPRKFVGKRPGTGFGGHAGHPKRVGYFTRLKLSILNSVVPHESHDTIYEAIQKLTPVVKKTKKSFYSTALTYYQNPLVAGFVADYISAYFGLVRAEQQTRFSDVKGEERRKQIRTEQSSKTFQKQEGGGGGEELEPEKERGPGARGGKIDPKTGKYFHDQIHEGPVGGRYYITPEGTYSYVGGGEHPPEPQEQHRALEGKRVLTGPFGGHIADTGAAQGLRRIGGKQSYDVATHHGSILHGVESELARKFAELQDTLPPELHERSQITRVKVLLTSAGFLDTLADNEGKRIKRTLAGEGMLGTPEETNRLVNQWMDMQSAYTIHADLLYKQAEDEMRSDTSMAWDPIAAPFMHIAKISNQIKEFESAGVSVFRDDAERKAVSDTLNGFIVMQIRVSDVFSLKKKIIESGKSTQEILGKLANAMSLIVDGMPNLQPIAELHKHSIDIAEGYAGNEKWQRKMNIISRNLESVLNTASETVLSFAQAAEGFQVAADPPEPPSDKMIDDVMAGMAAMPPMLRITLPSVRLSAYREAPYTAYHQNESHIIRMFDQGPKMHRVLAERGQKSDDRTEAWLSMNHISTLYHETGHNVLDRYAGSHAKLFQTYERLYGRPLSVAARDPSKVFYTKHAIDMFNDTGSIGNGLHEDFAETFKEVLTRRIYSDNYRSVMLPKKETFRSTRLYEFAERLADAFFQPVPKELEGMYDLLTKYDPQVDEAFRKTGIDLALATYRMAGLPSPPAEAPRAPAIGPGEGMPEGPQEPTPEEFVALRARNEAKQPLGREIEYKYPKTFEKFKGAPKQWEAQERRGLKWISPDEYFEAVTKGFSEKQEKRKGGKPLTVEEHMKQFQTPAAKERIAGYAKKLAAGEEMDPLWIERFIETGEMRGQEGRHRALAAKAIGIKKVPVVESHQTLEYEDVDPETYRPPKWTDIDKQAKLAGLPDAHAAKWVVESFKEIGGSGYDFDKEKAQALHDAAISKGLFGGDAPLTPKEFVGWLSEKVEHLGKSTAHYLGDGEKDIPELVAYSTKFPRKPEEEPEETWQRLHSQVGEFKTAGRIEEVHHKYAVRRMAKEDAIGSKFNSNMKVFMDKFAKDLEIDPLTIMHGPSKLLSAKRTGATALAEPDHAIKGWAGNPTAPDAHALWTWAKHHYGGGSLDTNLMDEIAGGMTPLTEDEAEQFHAQQKMAQEATRKFDPNYNKEDDTITLYRGVSLDDRRLTANKNSGAKEFALGHNLLESWSTSPRRAADFGTIILVKKIPLANVVDSHIVNENFLPTESEYIVASPDEYRTYSHDEWREASHSNYADVMAEHLARWEKVLKTFGYDEAKVKNEEARAEAVNPRSEGLRQLEMLVGTKNIGEYKNRSASAIWQKVGEMLPAIKDQMEASEYDSLVEKANKYAVGYDS